MRRVYVAAAYAEADLAREVARIRRDGGDVIVSTWHDAPVAGGDPSDPKAREGIALQCLREVDVCDEVIVLSAGRPRGAYFEAGYAYGRGKRVTWVGRAMAICHLDDPPVAVHPVFDCLPMVRP